VRNSVYLKSNVINGYNLVTEMRDEWDAL